MTEPKQNSSIDSKSADDHTQDIIHSLDTQQQQLSDGPNEILSNDEHNSNDKRTDEAAELMTCRLRHGLNEHCLLEIFNFLDVIDLLQLCEVDVYYKDLIQNWIIGKRLINFRYLNSPDNEQTSWTTKNIFEMFGKSISKIKFYDRMVSGHFEEFLQSIIQYSAVGSLTEMQFNFAVMTAYEATKDAAVPFFSNLRKLTLTQDVWAMNAANMQFLVRIIEVASNLTHLTLNDVDIYNNEWLSTANGLENLRELRLNRSFTNGISNLPDFLRTKSNLEVFSYNGDDVSSRFADTLVKCCPQLHTFAHLHLNNPYRNAVNRITKEMAQRYSFLCQMKNLKEILLTSYTQCGSDLYYPLIQLSSEKILAANIEKMTFYIDHTKAIELPESIHYGHYEFARFKKLKVVELLSTQKGKIIDLHAGFIAEFLSKLPNIQNFIVSTDNSKLRNINKIIDIVPSISELNVSQSEMHHMPVEMLRIVKSIRKRRACEIDKGHQNPKRFHLVINSKQSNELTVYKDINTILTTGVVDKESIDFHYMDF